MLRDEISQNPELKHRDVRRKAERVAREKGILEDIWRYWGTLLMAQNIPGARAEGQCSADSNHSDFLLWYIILITLTIGIGLGIWISRMFERRNAPMIVVEQPAVQNTTATRNIGVQAQTTYTAVRGVQNPRFQPLPEASHGAFSD